MSAADLATPKEEIRRAALAAGFDAARFAAPDYGARSAADLAAFLAEGRAGTMDWLAREPERRGDPKALWPEVRSILVLGANYAPARDPRAILAQKEHGAISAYAQGDDYHELMKTRAKSLARAIAERNGVAVKVSAGRASTPISSAASSGRGCSWPRSSSRSICRPMSLKGTTAAPAPAALRHAPPARSPGPTGSMRAPASPI